MLHNLAIIPDERDLEVEVEMDTYFSRPGRAVVRFSMVAPEEEDFLWALERLALQIMKNVGGARARRSAGEKCVCSMPTIYFSPEGRRGHCSC